MAFLRKKAVVWLMLVALVIGVISPAVAAAEESQNAMKQQREMFKNSLAAIQDPTTGKLARNFDMEGLKLFTQANEILKAGSVTANVYSVQQELESVSKSIYERMSVIFSKK